MPLHDMDFGEPVGPWAFDHWIGAAIVVLIFLGLGPHCPPVWLRRSPPAVNAIGHAACDGWL